jgi:hypothetical protein
LPDGNTYDTGEEFEIRFIVRDPDGIESFKWGIFTQNQTGLMGGDVSCHNQTDCRHEEEVEAPPIRGTFIVGADAVDSKGNTHRGIAEVYIQ